jgi:hypothetical protein
MSTKRSKMIRYAMITIVLGFLKIQQLSSLFFKLFG